MMAAAAVVVCLVAVGGCSGSPTSPTKTPAFSQVDLVVGDGAAVVSGNVLTVNYTGWLYDPTKTDNKGGQFDSSIGGDPYVFTIGVGAVIEGWDVGLIGMKVGGTRRLIVPPSNAYGTTRVSAIPANATLVFDITLISLE
jgi:FKBP-type peptidyl-prolyl cis-trans isomerase